MTEEMGQARYRGTVTVGSPGRVRLHGREGGISQLIWDALENAGWLSHVAGLEPTLDLFMRVPGLSGGSTSPASGLSPLPGRPRRPAEPGRADSDGSVSRRYIGPLHPRGVPGLRLVETEWRGGDFDSYEDLLFAAADKAGWLPADPYDGCNVEIADVEIRARVTPYGRQ
jgi:hypothetical protein